MHRFVRYYLADDTRNGAKAYIRAGYKVKNSYVASICASQLLNDPRIQAEIERVIERVNAKLEAKVEDRVRSWLQQANTTIGDVLTWDSRNGVRLRPFEQLDPTVLRAIKSLSIGRAGVRVEMSTHDAEDKLARHLGMYKAQMQMTGADGEALIPLEAARALVAAFDKAVAEGRVKPPEPPPGLLPALGEGGTA